MVPRPLYARFFTQRWSEEMWGKELNVLKVILFNYNQLSLLLKTEGFPANCKKKKKRHKLKQMYWPDIVVCTSVSDPSPKGSSEKHKPVVTQMSPQYKRWLQTHKEPGLWLTLDSEPPVSRPSRRAAQLLVFFSPAQYLNTHCSNSLH